MGPHVRSIWRQKMMWQGLMKGNAAPPRADNQNSDARWTRKEGDGARASPMLTGQTARTPRRPPSHVGFVTTLI